MDVKITVDNDANGNPAISSLYVSFDIVPVGGINSNILKNIKFEKLLIDYFNDNQDNDFTETEKQLIISKAKEVQGDTKPYSNQYYAALSYLYIDTYKRYPMVATNTLSKLLGMPKRTLVNRLATARKLNILTKHSAGKAGGSLTSFGLNQLKQVI
jgi:hypothetical protein